MEAEWIIVIFTAISFLVMIVGSWVALNVKLKEFDMKIKEIENKIDTYADDRTLILEKIEKNNELMWKKLDKLADKFDEKFDLILILKTEHDQMKQNCEYNKNNEK
jgi:uncharacterized membrane protein YhiD involved in acid resistance